MLPGITPALFGAGVSPFPVIQSVVQTNNAASTSHSVNLPTCNVGDLLLVFLGGAGITAVSADWNSLDTLSAVYRVATGADALTVTLSGSFTLTAIAYRITDYIGPPESASVTGSGVTTIDPPALVPSWGANRNLWFATCLYNYPSAISLTATPANYGGGIFIAPSIGPNNGAVYASTRKLNASSDDPGVFNLSAAGSPRARTVAVRGKGDSLFGDGFTKLLMHMDGANNAVVFPDSAYATPRGNATVSGGVKVSTAQSKFGGASAGFTGTGYLSYADHPDFSFGAGGWTIDLWARVNTLGVQYALFGKNNAGLTNGYCLYVNASGTVQIAWLPSDAVFVGMQTGVLVTDTNWHHYVVQRYGTAMQIYFDGVLGAQGSITASASIVANTNPLVIGQVGDLAAINLNGNIDEFRLVKGRALFPGPFTPPNAPYP